MLDRYAEPPGAGGNAHPMETGELIEYLKDIDDFSVPPWVAVMEKTEAIGDPASPSREHTAVMRWLGKAMELWEKEFPLESRLANQCRRLKPLAAALAITDAGFMKPGAHPLHQLLDTIQERAIGWQSRLDRVGTALEEQITQAVDSSRVWFQFHDTDLSKICADFSAAAEKDQARAQRMVQRVVEAEAGKVRTAAAKQEAARMINAILEKYPAPAEIGEFIKGPWYTSAQLLLLKFGTESENWKNMSATTETLMDSLQSLETADEQRRQRIFEVVTQLPNEMRRWLVSLHHDTEAVNEAMGMVEFIHLRILREQPIELQNIDPIVIEDSHVLEGDTSNSKTLKRWSEGQWFMLESEGSVLRVQLVLKGEESQQLLFTNMAGLKVMQLHFEEFVQLLINRKAVPLLSGASFSLSLARAAGVTSVEILEALASAMADTDTQKALDPEPGPESKPEPDPETDTAGKQGFRPAVPSDFLPAEDEADPLLSTQMFGKGGSDTSDAPLIDFESDRGTARADTLNGELAELQPEEPDFSEAAADLLEIAPDLPEAEPDLAEVVPDLPEADADSEEAGSGANDAEPEPPRDSDSSSGFLADQAKAIGIMGGFSPRKPAAASNGDMGAGKSFEEESRRFLDEASAEEIPPEHTDETPADNPEVAAAAPPKASPRAGGDPVGREINLPVGVWIGFHDGETPVMARLAVHDPQEDYFIFVNRKGVKIRQVSTGEFLALIDGGMVEIIEASSNFRDAVTEIRNNTDQ